MNLEIPREISNRISGFETDASYFPFSTEVLADSTPVPFFGDYSSAEIVTVSINPSSHEFPAIEKGKRLTHLSTIKHEALLTAKYEADFFQKGMRIEDAIAIEQIHDGMLNYFKSGNWYEGWFDKPENALNIGFSASYFENKDRFPVRAVHTDLSPWATPSWSKLSPITQNAMIDENRKFLNWFLALEQFKEVVILGNQSKEALKKSSRNIQINFPFELIENGEPERVEGFDLGSFSNGIIRLQIGKEVVEKRYFYNSYSPTVQRQNNSNQEKRYELFGAYIKKIVDRI